MKVLNFSLCSLLQVSNIYKNLNSTQFSSLTSASLENIKTRKTSMYNFHLEKGAKMVNFANYMLPALYNNMTIIESHLHTRSKCSLFDVSHMLQTKIIGKDGDSFLESLTVSDIKSMKPNQACLSLFTNSNGGIIDDLIIVKADEGYYFIVTNAGCREKDTQILHSACLQFQKEGKDVALEAISDDYSLLALQGPTSAQVLQQLIDYNVKEQRFMTSKVATICGIKDCRITRCGYTGEDGFEISVKNESVIQLAQSFINTSNDVKLAGLGVRDTLRIEAGLCLYGKDINEETTPIEAGLSWTIGKSRRVLSNFPGSEIILKQLKKGFAPSMKRVGLCEVKKGPPLRSGEKIFDTTSDECIGTVTSGCPSPSLQKNIAIGYVNHKNSKVGTTVICEVRGRKYEWKICKMPFVKSNYYSF